MLKIVRYGWNTLLKESSQCLLYLLIYLPVFGFICDEYQQEC